MAVIKKYNIQKVSPLELSRGEVFCWSDKSEKPTFVVISNVKNRLVFEALRESGFGMGERFITLDKNSSMAYRFTHKAKNDYVEQLKINFNV